MAPERIVFSNLFYYLMNYGEKKRWRGRKTDEKRDGIILLVFLSNKTEWPKGNMSIGFQHVSCYQFIRQCNLHSP